MAFDPSFLEELRARLPIAGIIGRKVKLQRSGRQWKACCPFHGEKTPSFYIYDDHYHCFGCQAHGDIISFVMQSENRTFVDAVSQLAREAGLSLPSSVQEDGHERKLAGLHHILQRAQSFFHAKLFEKEGQDALSYLRRRGLNDSTIRTFGLGWAPHRRGELVSFMSGEGFTPDQLRLAGLLRDEERSEHGSEFFFRRVMFPILDRRGRTISFGGRVLNDGQPKYLNGPETDIFQKRHTLFNLCNAHEALRNKEQRLVVVEGYLDVLAMHQAGYRAAVAPLGTAVGEEQLELLWREHGQPVLCFDGDDAGRRAAFRTLERALPRLTSEHTLLFCQLPSGDDPDSLIRRDGPQAFARVLNRSVPLVEQLFAFLTPASRDIAPEARAHLRKRLEAAAALIAERALAREYRRVLLDRFFAYFRHPTRRSRDGHHIPLSPVIAPMAEISKGRYARLRVMCALILRYPEILPETEQAFCRLELPPTLAKLREALSEWLAHTENPEDLREEKLQAWLKGREIYPVALDTARALGRNPSHAGRAADLLALDRLQEWWHLYGLMNFPTFEAEIMRDVQVAMNDPALQTFPPALLARYNALQKLRQGEIIEDDDVVAAPNS